MDFHVAIFRIFVFDDEDDDDLAFIYLVFFIANKFDIVMQEIMTLAYLLIHSEFKNKQMSIYTWFSYKPSWFYRKFNWRKKHLDLMHTFKSV